MTDHLPYFAGFIIGPQLASYLAGTSFTIAVGISTALIVGYWLGRTAQ